MISKHQLLEVVRIKATVRADLKCPPLLVEYGFPWRVKRFAIFHQQGLGSWYFCCGSPSLLVPGCSLVQEPPVRTSGREQPVWDLSCDTVAMSHRLCWPLCGCSLLRLGTGVWASELDLKAFALQEPLTSWLPQLTLQVLPWQSRCSSSR